MKPSTRSLTIFNALIQNSTHILLWAKLWLVRTCRNLYYKKAFKVPMMYCVWSDAMMHYWACKNKARDTEFVVLLTWQQPKCQHEVISFPIVFPKNIRRLIYIYYIVIEGYRQLCFAASGMCLALFSNHLKKAAK